MDFLPETFQIPENCQNIVLILVAILVVVVVYFVHVYNNKSQDGAKKVSFTEPSKKNTSPGSGITMYGKDSCPWCKRQKSELGDEWGKVNYVNCAETPDLCKENEIAALPTWVIKGERSEGFMKKDTFVSKCQA